MILVNDVPVEFGQYPNGEAVVPDLDWSVVPARVRLRWEGDEDLLRLALVRGLIGQRYGNSELWPTLFIDYMPYSRMDREQGDHCFSLKYVAEAIKRLEWRRICVVEPHSDVTLKLLDAEPVWSTAALTPAAMKDMTFDYLRDWLVLPDEGAYRRYADLLPDVLLKEANLVVMEKRRDFESGKILGLDIAFRRVPRLRHVAEGGQALIIDDLSSRGGTFVQAATIMRHSSLRCSKVNLLVTHMEPVGYQGELPHLLSKVYCTDTIPRPDDVPVPANFHVFDRKDWL